MPEWFTPPQVARARGLRTAKVLAWIRSGELEGVNCAEKHDGRPRWRISAEALEAFDSTRSSRQLPQRVARERRMATRQSEVIEFFR